MLKMFTLVALIIATLSVVTTVRGEGAQLPYTATNRVSCVAEMGGYHFNLKELSLPIDE